MVREAIEQRKGKKKSCSQSKSIEESSRLQDDSHLIELNPKLVT